MSVLTGLVKFNEDVLMWKEAKFEVFLICSLLIIVLSF